MAERLPFTTDDVRDQCAQFGDAPLAHPLPVKDLLKMCQYIDDLERDRNHWREARRISQEAAEEFKLRIDATLSWMETDNDKGWVTVAEVRRALEPPKW